MGRGGKKRTMRTLTPMQIDTLTTFYYGEARCAHLHHLSLQGGELIEWFNADGVKIGGRITSLRRRRLLKWTGPAECRGLICTDEARRIVEEHEKNA